MRFKGMSVLVSGATGGFGRRAAERFAAEGASLVLSDLAPEPLEEMAAGIEAATATLAGDVSREEVSRDLVALALERFGRLDIALNNAGIVHGRAKLPDIASEEARRVIEVDLMGVFFALKHQLPAMADQFARTGRGGRIVNLASVAGIAGAPRLGIYAAAKHGVVGLTRTAAVEFATRGVAVNAVCPSYARTPMATSLFEAVPPEGREAAEAEMTRGVPMKRLAEIDEVVEVILFAGDPANGFMTGQALACDGGITAI